MFLPSSYQNKMFMSSSCNVHVKSKKYFVMFMPKVRSSCHVHATSQKFMKMVKSMNFVHDIHDKASNPHASMDQTM